MNGKRWSPFTRLVWLVLGGGAFVSMFGWLAVLIFAAVNVAVALALGAVAASSRRQSAARADKALDDILTRYRAETKGPGR